MIKFHERILTKFTPQICFELLKKCFFFRKLKHLLVTSHASPTNFCPHLESRVNSLPPSSKIGCEVLKFGSNCLKNLTEDCEVPRCDRRHP